MSSSSSSSSSPDTASYPKDDANSKVDGSQQWERQPQHQQGQHHRPIIFLDIDGVLNTTRHSPQIHLEDHLVSRLKHIAESTDALFVLTTFWRHFHDYITYTLHRHGVDVIRHMLPWPVGVTCGKQCTKTFLHHFHRAGRMTRQENNGLYSNVRRSYGQQVEGTKNDKSENEILMSTEDEEEEYGQKYLGGSSSGIVCGPGDTNIVDDCHNYDGTDQGYGYHCEEWRYIILDDRLSAVKPNTPLFDRFVLVNPNTGLTEEDAVKAIRLLLFGATSS